MPITRRADYATRFMTQLALEAGDTPVPASRLATSAEVPYEFARTILTQLTAAGLVTSVRGAHGGVRLARPASEISVLDVLEAVEEASSANTCTQHPGSCARTPTCAMHTVWCQADALLGRFLATQDLASIVGSGNGKGDGTAQGNGKGEVR